MSLKENVAMVKEELNSEEKFFENAVKAERFVKKYKNLLISAIVLIVLALGANAAYEAKMRSQTESVNAALATLANTPEDSEAIETLQTLNPKLYDLWRLSNALKKGDVSALNGLKASNAVAVADLAMYHEAVLNKDIKALEAYSMKPDSIYKDMAQLDLAVILIQENRIEEARQKLGLIAKESPVYRYAQPLMHFGVQ